jgi:hypothetical protein
VIDKGNVSISIDLKLQDCFYSYYETGALKRAYTRHVLRQITGDNNFTFENMWKFWFALHVESEIIFYFLILIEIRLCNNNI